MSTAPAGHVGGHGGDLLGEAVERAALDAAAEAGRGQGDAEHERRIGRRIGAGAQLDLAVDADHARGDAVGLAAERALEAAPRLVGDPRDRSRGGGDVGHQRVGAGVPRRDRRRVLILESQHVARPAGGAVQRDPCPQQRGVALVEGGGVAARQRQPTLRRPPQRLHVAQATVAVLEVGLERVRDLAGAVLALADPALQLAEPSLAMLRPVASPGVDHLRRQRRVAGDQTGGEQRGRGVEVGLGEVELVVDACARRARASIRRPTAGTRWRTRTARRARAVDVWTSSRSRSLNGANSPRP